MTDKSTKVKIKGTGLAKFVWIVGALFTGIYMISRFAAIASPDENAADCIKEGIRMLLYFAAFVFGLIYLFRSEQKKTVFIGAVLYAAAYAFGIFAQLTEGSKIAGSDIVTMFLNLIAYIVFALFMGIVVKGQPAKAVDFCGRFWYAPAALLVLFGLIEALWTELARAAGFLWDGFFVDFALVIILTIPVFVMVRVVKNRAKMGCMMTK